MVKQMKHVTFGEKSLLMDDETADWLIEYATALGVAGSSDHVTVSAVGADGNEVVATFLLNGGTELMAESSTSEMQPPANEEAVRYMQERTSALRNPPPAQPEEEAPGQDDLADLL
jgi:hypothetical protein